VTSASVLVLDVLDLREALAHLEHRDHVGLQAQFLSELSSELPTRYPLIKGVVYVDAPQV